MLFPYLSMRSWVGNQSCVCLLQWVHGWWAAGTRQLRALTPPDWCGIPRFRMAPGAERMSSCARMLSIKLDRGRCFRILLVVLKVLCTSMASDKWGLGLYLGLFLPSPPTCLWCLASKTNGNCWTFPGGPEGVWFCACAMLCFLTGMPPLPSVFLQECVPGSVPWQSHPPTYHVQSGPSLFRWVDSLHVPPRLRFPYKQNPSSLPTLSLTQCLVQNSHSLDSQTSKKHKIPEADERENGNPHVFWGQGPPMRKCNTFAIFDRNATGGRFVFQPGPCFFCPWVAVLRHYPLRVWWGNSGLSGLVQGKAKQPASFTMQQRLQRISGVGLQGRQKFHFCMPEKNIFSVEKNFYLDFPSFPGCIHCRLQTNGRCLGRQTVWSDIAQWNHMVSLVILIIHFCELHNFNIFTSQKAMSMKFSMGHPPSFSVHKLSLKRWFLSCIHSMSKFRLISLRNTYCWISLAFWSKEWIHVPLFPNRV